MHTLFTTFQKDLNAFFRSLQADDIRDCCSPAIYRRGEEYFEEDAVERITYNDTKTLLKATVCGGDDYTVTIALRDGEVSGSCTCPYGDECKHIVATLLCAADDDTEFEIERMDDGDAENLFHQYLQNLSKDELVALVEKFASEQFRTEVKNRFANANSAQKTFNKVEQKIRKMFDNHNLMHVPEDFNNALDNELEKLSGFEKPLCKEIEGLLLYIIERVDDAFDDGYLYDDYGDDYYVASHVFKEFVVRYVACLNNSEKTKFIAKLDDALQEQSYSTFESLREVANSAFSDDDLPHLKNVLMSDYKNISSELAGKYYDRVSSLLSYDEKATVLEILLKGSDKRAIELAALHDAHGNLSKAIETLSAWLAENRSSYYSRENAWSFYLDLLKKGNRDLTDIAADAIINCSTDTMLSKIVSITAGDPACYELQLEEKNAGAMLRYLQKENRLPEALALMKRRSNISEDLVHDFFKAHKMVFPDDATTHFCKVIDKNLKETGDRYYEAIADTIRQMMKVNQGKANEYLVNIRTNYKRRRNLMAMLNGL
jgi:uncharacterized Zn finger protein